MKKIFEAVINVSEGRDHNKIKLIVKSANVSKQAKVIHIDSGIAANRTVITILGTKSGITSAAKSLYQRATQLIDMEKHTGTHPRMGAVDVCPIIPLEDATIEDAKEIALEIAEFVAENLKIPVYLYAESAQQKDHYALPKIRAGEYEFFKEKIKTFPPDLGPPEVHPSAGVTAIGARGIMIAYNVNVPCSLEEASLIAKKLRSSGDGTTPGRLKALQAKAWYIEDFDQVQITCNLHNYKETNLHTLFEAVKEELAKLGEKPNGSEIVGLCPAEALVIAGKFYKGKISGNNKEELGASKKQKTKEIVRLAVKELGLKKVKNFSRKEIIEYHSATFYAKKQK
ncbi:MAG: glutamate formimidoyltransferase [Spirochaetales bacterium]|nr:glutamate formimidoyltransferase [Spirochaetales bacterium]